MFISQCSRFGALRIRVQLILKTVGYIACGMLLLTISVRPQLGAFIARKPEVRAEKPLVQPNATNLKDPVANAQLSASPVTTSSAASFEPSAIAPESIVAGYGGGLAIRLEVASTNPLPTSLAGTQVKVKDKAGVERLAPLFYVSPGQVNYLIPAGTAMGAAIVTIQSGDGTISTGGLQIQTLAPAIFTANGNGRGVPAALIIRVRGNQVLYEEIKKFDQDLNRFIPKPIELGPDGDRVFLSLYVSGLHKASKEDVLILLDGIPLVPDFVGSAEGYSGLEQINVEIPRDRVRRGLLRLWVQTKGFVSSNITEIEVAFSQYANAPQVAGFDVSEVAAGQTLLIKGANFSADPAQNSVVFDDKQVGCANLPSAAAKVISASAKELNVIVPYGAASSRVSVRTVEGEGSSESPLPVLTSVSGFVEDTQHQPIEGATVRMRFSGNNSCDAPNICARTNAEGAFVLTGVPSGNSRSLEVDGSTAIADPPFGRLPDPPKTLVLPGRDNYYCGFITLQRQNGVCSGSGCSSAPFSVESEAFGLNADSTNQIANPKLELAPNAVVRAQDGTIINKLNVALFENGRTPSPLPFGQYSSAIVQIMPLGATITPGAKLVIPNPDRIPAGSTVHLYQFDLTPGSFTEGSFIKAGEAKVTADGRWVETAANAITQTSYYFVSVDDRPTTTLYGHVVESDGLTPVRRALVVTRGQYIFTDVNGGYVLRGVPVLGANDALTIDVSVLRPDGRVDRTEMRVNLPNNDGNPLIVMPRQKVNRPPVILVPPELNLQAGETRDFGLVISDPDRDDADASRAQMLEATFSLPTFGALVFKPADGNGPYVLRMSPKTNDLGGTITITARDSLGVSTTRKLLLKVSSQSGLTTQDQSLGTDEDSQRQITLTVANSGGALVGYQIVNLPVHGRLTGTPPNLTYFPDKDWNGLDSFTFKASAGTTVSNTATVYLAIKPVNDWPVLTVPGQQFVNAGQTLSFDIMVAEVDGDELSVTAQGVSSGGTPTALPAGATFTQVSGMRWRFTWTPTIRQIMAQTSNDYLLLFRGNDGVSPTQRAVVTITAFAQWAETSGIEGGNVTALLPTDKGLFVGTQDGGVYRSTNDGRIWTPAKTGLPSKATIYSLGAQGGALFAGTAEGVFRSLDNGEKWWPIPLEMFVATFVTRGANLYAGGTAKPVSLGGLGSVAVSMDNGNSWKPASEGLMNEAVGNLAVSGTSLFAGTECRVFRYNDNLQKWEPASTSIPVFCPQDSNLGRSYIFALAANGTSVFAGTSTQFGSNFFVSTTDGDSWRSVDVPTVANVRAIALKGTNVYAGTEGSGIYVSANNGQSWRQINDGLPPLARISKLIATGTNLYAGLQSGGLFVLPENSERWQPSNTGLASSPVNKLAVVDGQLFAATDSSGVMVSTNNGQSWTARNNGLTNSNITTLTFDGTNLFAGTYGSGVFVSTDKGLNWQAWGIGLPQDLQVRSLFSNGSDLFVGGQFPYGLFRSTNDGFTWRPARTGLECPPTICNTSGYHEIVAMVAIGSRVFATSGLGGVFYSDDQGESWKPSGNSPLIVTALVTNGSSLFVTSIKNVGDTPGRVFSVFRSDDRGLAWKEVQVSGAPTHADSLPLSMFADGENIFLGTANNGVFLSTDNGNNWKPFNLGAGRVECRSFAQMGDSLFVGTASGIVRLSNSSQSWTGRSNGLAPVPVNTLLVNGANFLAGTLSGGVFRSTDQGQNWVSASGASPNSLPPNANVRSFVAGANGSPIFAAAFGDGVFRSDNQGQSWSNVTSNPLHKSINALALNSQYLFAATDGGGIFRSTDQGQTWIPLKGLPSRLVLTLAVNGTAIFAGTDGEGVFVSTDNGDNWKPLNNGLTAQDVQSLAFSERYLFAGTLSGGVFRWDSVEQRWRSVNKDLPLRLPVFALASAGGKLFAGTIYGVFVSKDDGNGWEQVNAGLQDVSVASLAVSGNILIAGTRTGGVFISQF